MSEVKQGVAIRARSGRFMQDIIKNRSEVTFVLLFFVGLAIVGVIAGGFFVQDFARARASHAWPVVEGVVLSPRAEKDELRYAYSFRGQSYESQRERVFGAQLFVPSGRDYAPGQFVAVHVDPDAPSYSVLTPGGAGFAVVFFSVLSGLCVFIGVGGIVWVFSDGVDQDPDETPDGAAANPG
ncbi:MAG: DUF3592 domain-containing protein [Pseudomonadota bacterium]